MEIIKIIPVNDNTRIKVAYDRYPTNPREMFQEDISVYTLAQNSSFIEVVPGKNSLETDLDIINEYATNDKNLRVAIDKYFTRKNLPYILVEKEQSDTIWYIEPKVLKEFTDPKGCLQSCINEYYAWGAGEIYTLGLENKKIWVDSEDSTNTMETWEEIDTADNIYEPNMHDDATVLSLAKEHFDLTNV